MKNLDVNLKEQAIEAIKVGNAEAQAEVIEAYFRILLMICKNLKD